MGQVSGGTAVAKAAASLSSVAKASPSHEATELAAEVKQEVTVIGKGTEIKGESEVMDEEEEGGGMREPEPDLQVQEEIVSALPSEQFSDQMEVDFGPYFEAPRLPRRVSLEEYKQRMKGKRRFPSEEIQLRDLEVGGASLQEEDVESLRTVQLSSDTRGEMQQVKVDKRESVSVTQPSVEPQRSQTQSFRSEKAVSSKFPVVGGVHSVSSASVSQVPQRTVLDSKPTESSVANYPRDSDRSVSTSVAGKVTDRIEFEVEKTKMKEQEKARLEKEREMRRLRIEEEERRLKERQEREKKEKEEREKKEREEKERKERMDKQKKEREERERKERMDRQKEREERERKERMDRQKEREERERKERMDRQKEREERERKERVEREEKEKKEREWAEKMQELEKEWRKEKEREKEKEMEKGKEEREKGSAHKVLLSSDGSLIPSEGWRSSPSYESRLPSHASSPIHPSPGSIHPPTFNIPVHAHMKPPRFHPPPHAHTLPLGPPSIPPPQPPPQGFLPFPPHPHPHPHPPFHRPPPGPFNPPHPPPPPPQPDMWNVFSNMFAQHNLFPQEDPPPPPPRSPSPPRPPPRRISPSRRSPPPRRISPPRLSPPPRHSHTPMSMSPRSRSHSPVLPLFHSKTRSRSRSQSPSSKVLPPLEPKPRQLDPKQFRIISELVKRTAVKKCDVSVQASPPRMVSEGTQDGSGFRLRCTATQVRARTYDISTQAEVTPDVCHR